MIIDVHVHVYPPDVISGWERIADREAYFAELVRGKVHRWADADDLLSAMDEDGVDESWICGFGFKDIGLCRLCNDYVLDAAARSKGRLRAMCVVPPMSRGAEAEAERCAELGAIGVGEIFPEGQDWRICDIRETWRLAAVCHERGMFAMIHAAEPVGREYPGKGRTGPREAYLMASNHPELKIILAHWGGGLFIYESMRDVSGTLKNVWYDTAAAPFLYGSNIFECVRMSCVGEKILYGSDYPILRLPRFEKMLDESPLHGEELDALMSGNASKLLASLGRDGRSSAKCCDEVSRKSAKS
ncbi:MAG: amidohydrolase [Synergistaceae bacterium]|jgi:predicted TIM-barrel fold metal-dependent hydrolase|nr:amidohydrolase [Synergistaceae bacterium]